MVFDAAESHRSLRILLGALVFVLGAQSIRFLFGSMAWYLRDTVGIGVIDLIPIALAPFLIGTLFPALSRWLTVRGAIWTGVWVLVLGRVVNQISNDPAVDLWASAASVAGFVGLLPLLLAMGRSTVVGGVLLGLAIDTAIRGMGLSLDLAYQAGAGAIAAVIGLGVATLYTLWACPTMERHGVPWGPGWLLIGIGPFLFFQFLVLQSQGWVSEVGGMGGPQSQLRIALLNVLALLLVARFERRRVATLLAAVVLITTLLLAEGPGTAFNVLAVLAVPAAGLVWASLVPDVYEGSVASSATYLVIGMTLLVVLGLAYYVPLDLSLGFDQTSARVGAVVLLGLIALGGVLSTGATRPGVTPQTWAFAAVASILPLIGLFIHNRSLDPPDTTEPIRVMTYNIHSGFSVAGALDLETLAGVIEDSRATVVGLQELSRGQLISGVADQLTLLQTRLGFEHVAYFGTTDPTFGNAVLSRFPIVEVQRTYLPQVGTPLRRGYLGTAIEIGDLRVLFVSTHLQHVNDRATHDLDPEGDLYPVHREQIEVILTEWGGVQPAILVGDFNARPGWAQIEGLLAAGWLDAWAGAGVGQGLTSPADDPQHRIDYIFHTPDLETIDVGVIQSLASDHLAVVADISPR